MGNCKTCRFWGHDYERACDAESCDDVPSVDGFVIRSGALDDSGLWARMITGPEFGCTRYQPVKQVRSVKG